MRRITNRNKSGEAIYRNHERGDQQKRERITENMVKEEINKMKRKKQEIDQVGKQSGLKKGGGNGKKSCCSV